jgi:hypothetical protein
MATSGGGAGSASTLVMDWLKQLVQSGAAELVDDQVNNRD